MRDVIRGRFWARPRPFRDFSNEKRETLADEGKAMPDGSFPIVNTSDLRNAIQAYGRAKNQEAAKRHIIKRARALDAVGMLPEDWGTSLTTPGSGPETSTSSLS